MQRYAPTFTLETEVRKVQRLVIYVRPFLIEDQALSSLDKEASQLTKMHIFYNLTTGITRLQGFEKFASLDTIWLNNNKLESVEGLEDCVRLKEIHLYSNRLRTLERYSFTSFKFLSRLTLNDNLLDDIENVLKELKVLRNLISLDLFNNPIETEDNYRLRVLAAMPTLIILDRHR